MSSVTVVIPAYNAEAFLADTLRSILDQTSPPTEVLVVDDGSTDGTADIARSFGSSIVLQQQANAGESVARNRGIESARGDWIAFCDADDLWLPEKLARQRAAISQRPDTLWSFCWYEEFGDSESRPPAPRESIGDLPQGRPFLVPGITILPSCAMVRRRARTRFPEWTTYSEDAIYFNDLFLEGPLLFLPDPLVRYRRHRSSGQRRPGAARKSAQSLIRWAKERDAVRPGLLLALLNSLVDKIQLAIWRRDWQRVEELRAEVLAAWPTNQPVPALLSRPTWPQWMYRVRDLLSMRSRVSSPASHAREAFRDEEAR